MYDIATLFNLCNVLIGFVPTVRCLCRTLVKQGTLLEHPLALPCILVYTNNQVVFLRERERERVAHRETTLYKFIVSICSFRSCRPLCVIVHHTEWQWQTHLPRTGWLAKMICKLVLQTTLHGNEARTYTRPANSKIHFADSAYVKINSSNIEDAVLINVIFLLSLEL